MITERNGDKVARRIKKGIPLRCLRSTPGGPVPFGSEEMKAFVPLTRAQAGKGSSSNITYAAYLEAMIAFIDNHLEDLQEVVSGMLGPADSRISEIEIVAEKHGSDYHPARIVIHAKDRRCSFVVNVALADRGKERLDQEFWILHNLNERIQPSFIPVVFFKDEQVVSLADGTTSTWKMFLGQWFDGFHEFHLTPRNNSGDRELVLWDFNLGYQRLTERQGQDLYQKAAFILTWYYNFQSGEEIFPWHHASGDFVARIEKGAVDVRLITVRQYASRSRTGEISESERLNYPLFFLANLTIRMRLDRYDGIGNMAWADSGCVKACVHGFLDALNQKASRGLCDGKLVSLLNETLRSLSPGDLAEIFQIVVGSYNESAPDVPVIMSHLTDHILETFLVLREITA